MPEWLKNAVQFETELSPALLAGRLISAFVMGCIAAGIYRLTHRRDTPIAPNFIPTLILLAILIAMVSQVIGSSRNGVALAFSLVGALSIVRFRTVIQDTRDTAFVIFAVVLGMAIGAGFLDVAVMGTVVVGCAAALLCIVPQRAAVTSGEQCTLNLRVSIGVDPDQLLESVLAKHLEAYELLSTGTVRQGAALELSYQIRLRPGASQASVVAELNRVEGIQNVELRRL